MELSKAETEDGEGFVREGLLFGAFAFEAGSIFGEADGVMADFVPGKRRVEDLPELDGGAKVRFAGSIGSEGGTPLPGPRATS